MPQVQVLYRPPANSTLYGFISVRGFLFSVPGRNDSFPEPRPASSPPFFIRKAARPTAPCPYLHRFRCYKRTRGASTCGGLLMPLPCLMPHASPACFFRFLSTGSADVKKSASRSKYVSPDPIFLYRTGIIDLFMQSIRSYRDIKK